MGCHGLPGWGVDGYAARFSKKMRCNGLSGWGVDGCEANSKKMRCRAIDGILMPRSFDAQKQGRDVIVEPCVHLLACQACDESRNPATWTPEVRSPGPQRWSNETETGEWPDVRSRCGIPQVSPEPNNMLPVSLDFPCISPDCFRMSPDSVTQCFHVQLQRALLLRTIFPLSRQMQMGLL